MSTQLAANVITLAASAGACLVYLAQTAHGNRVRDLQFIATQRNLLSTLARNVVPPGQLAAYDADELLAALEETAHAFNAGLVGRVAVDYLKPQFGEIIVWSLNHPAIAPRWLSTRDGPHFAHLRRYMEAERIRSSRSPTVRTGTAEFEDAGRASVPGRAALADAAEAALGEPPSCPETARTIG
jgi:hypothetical protein